MSFLTLALSCAPDTGAEGTGPAKESETCSTDDDCSTGRICVEESCIGGDRSEDPSTAIEIFWETDVDGQINPAGDVDWFAISAKGGEFARVQVDTLEDANELDSVVSVYDAAGHRIAWEDEHPAGNVSTYDSVCYAYFAESGTYYVAVEAASTFYGSGEVGGFDSDYTLMVREVGQPGEPDSAQSVGSTLDVQAGSIYAFPWVLAEDADADYARIDLQYTGVWLTLVGAVNVEGSTAEPRYTLLAESGEPVLSKLSPNADDPAILVGTQGDRYVLGVADERGSGGSEVWGVTFVQEYGQDVGGEPESEPNDDLATANPLGLSAIEVDSGQAFGAFAQGTGGESADVYSLGVEVADARVTAYVYSAEWGSLFAATVEVLDATGEVVATATADEADPRLANLEVPEGEYFVRITGENEGSTPEGGYYYLVTLVTNYDVATD